MTAILFTVPLSRLHALDLTVQFQDEGVIMGLIDQKYWNVVHVIAVSSLVTAVPGCTYIAGSEMLHAIVPWIEETLNLPAYGMSADAFELFIDGSSQESVEAWELLKYAAAMQEVMLEQSQINGPRPTLMLSLAHYSGRILLPWHLPTGFSRAIRNAIQGTSNIHFTGEPGELWDQDVFFFERRDWTLDQWWLKWKDEICIKGIHTDFWMRFNSRYQIEPQGFTRTYTMMRNREVIRRSEHPF
jgi:hypothetical protein